jgi:hypothetical protein
MPQSSDVDTKLPAWRIAKFVTGEDFSGKGSRQMHKHYYTTALLTIFILWPICCQGFFIPQWRTNPGTTYAEWDFEKLPEGDEPSYYHYPEPKYVINPYGDVLLQVFAAQGKALIRSYVENATTRTGIWPLGYINITLKDDPSAHFYKHIQMQMTWSHLESYDQQPFVAELNSKTQAVKVDEIAIPDSAWMQTTFHLNIKPSQSSHIIHINGGIYLDEIVIDTIGMPEPTTLLLTISALPALFINRKKAR